MLFQALVIATTMVVNPKGQLKKIISHRTAAIRVCALKIIPKIPLLPFFVLSLNYSSDSLTIAYYFQGDQGARHNQVSHSALHIIDGNASGVPYWN